MAKSLTAFYVLGFLAAVAVAADDSHAALAPAPAPAPAPAADHDCMALMLNMMDCMSFLTIGGGNETTPDPKCCSELKLVVATDADCICSALTVIPSMGIEVNMTRAVALSPACGVSDFSVTDCPVSGGPSTSPSLPPAVHSEAPVPAPAPAPANSAAGTIPAAVSVISAIIFSLISV